MHFSGSLTQLSKQTIKKKKKRIAPDKLLVTVFKSSLQIINFSVHLARMENTIKLDGKSRNQALREFTSLSGSAVK